MRSKKFHTCKFECIGEIILSPNRPQPFNIENLPNSLGKGVYILANNKDRPIYIGKSNDVYNRLSGYIKASTRSHEKSATTNARIHGNIYRYLKMGKKLYIWYSPQDNCTKIEKELIKHFYPDEWWNACH